MIVEFRVKNFRSFRDEQVLSLVAGRESALPENCFTAGKLSLLRTAAIYGPNASGKSNLIRAVDFMRDFVLKSADRQPGSGTEVVPFRLDVSSRTQPSTFEVVFIMEGVRYQYGFALTKERVDEEWLLAFPRGSARNLVTRAFDHANKEISWKFGSHLKGEKNRLRELTRQNALFLSVAAKFAHEQLTPVYNWFDKHLRTVPPKGQFAPVTARALANVDGSEPEASEIKDFVLRFLEDSDLGIQDLEVRPIEVDEKVLPDDMPDEVKNRVLARLRKAPPVATRLAHAAKNGGTPVLFDLEEESDGTQRMFELAVPWLQMVTFGMTVFVDELEASLHPFLTRNLVEFVQNPEINKHGAQLVFATHDTTLLAPDLLRRDQVWFIEKDSASASRLYSMLDYKKRAARKGEAMQKGYLAGRYGAVPILKAFSMR